MKKVVLTCKPGYGFGANMGPKICARGYFVRQDDEDVIEVESIERGDRLEILFTPELIQSLEERGGIVTVDP